MRLDAIITAGGTPREGDPLYTLTQGKNKALLEVADKPMIQWVLDALSGSKKIGRVIVVGLPHSTPTHCQHPIKLLENCNNIIENIQAGVHEVIRENPNAKKVLLFASDIPTITPEMVDWLIAETESSDHDLYYTVVERSVMEKRFPSSNRTYVKLKDIDVCGGDMHAVKIQVAIQENPLYQEMINSRKNPLKQASLIGWNVIFLFLIHRLTLKDGVAFVSKRFGLNGKAVISPYAETGMDVDKPIQFEIITKDLLERA